MDTALFDAILSMDSYNRGYNPGISLVGSDPLNSPVVNGVTQIGNATIINNSSTALAKGVDEADGFYAVAYKLSDGQTVIAYRGTDQFLNGNGIGGDIANGYGSGSGLPDTPQTELAFQFYEAVAKTAGVSSITATGHSLGGGLAGLVDEVEGLSGSYVFESMAYAKAADILVSDRMLEDGVGALNYEILYNTELQTPGLLQAQALNDSKLLAAGYFITQGAGLVSPFLAQTISAIKGFQLDGTLIASEAMLGGIYNYLPVNTEMVKQASTTAVSDISIAGQALETIPASLGNAYVSASPSQSLSLGPNVTLDPAHPSYSAFDEHDAALQVLLTYAYTPDENVGTDWLSAAQYFWPVLYNNTFAQEIGMDEAGRYVTGTNVILPDHTYDTVMRELIAYSAINSGTEIFGDVGIQAFYHDADALGQALGTENPNGTYASTTSTELTTVVDGDSAAKDISEAFVQFAAQMAKEKVSAEALPGVSYKTLQAADTAADGILSLTGDPVLNVNFSTKLWETGQTGLNVELPEMVARDDLFDNIMTNDTAQASTIYSYMGQLWDSALDDGDPDITADNASDDIGQISFATTNSGAETINAAADSDQATLFVGGTGTNNIYVSAGNNIILAEGTDTVHVSGVGNSDLIVGNGSTTVEDDGTVAPIYITSGTQSVPAGSIMTTGVTSFTGGSGDYMVESLGNTFSGFGVLMDYQDYSSGGLTFNVGSTSGTVTGSGTDSYSDSVTQIYGTNSGDTYNFSGTTLAFIQLGTGNDTLNNLSDPGVFWGGGNDVLTGSDTGIISLPSGITSGTFSYASDPTQVTATETYDFNITIGSGSITLKNGLSVSYDPTNPSGDDYSGGLEQNEFGVITTSGTTDYEVVATVDASSGAISYSTTIVGGSYVSGGSLAIGSPTGGTFSLNPSYAAYWSRGGNDSIVGGSASAQIATSTGNDTIDSGSGNDSIIEQGGANLLTADGGSDLVEGYSTESGDVINFASGSLAGINTANSNGNLVLTDGSTVTVAGFFNGTSTSYTVDVEFGGGHTVALQIDGNGSLISPPMTDQNYTLPTGVNAINMTGGNNITVAGNASSDILGSNTGANTLIGNSTAGDDTFVVHNTADVVSESVSGGAALVASSVNWTLGAGFNTLALLGTADLSGTANAAADVITGNNGNDVLSDNSGASADTLIGNSAAGRDTFLVHNAADAVSENNGGGLVDASVSYTLGAAVDGLTLVGSAALTATGNSNDDILSDNTGAYADTLIGNSADGGDTFVVNNTNDRITETTSGGDATVESSVNWTLGANMAALVLTGSAALVGTGNAADALLVSNTGADTLIGVGASTGGSDTFVVNNTGDSLTETASGGTVLVESSVNWTLAANFDQLTLTGSANLIGTGNAANDILIGNTGADTLVGNSASGADTFVVNNTGDALTEANSGTGVLVESTVSWTLGTGMNTLTLAGSDITGKGNSSTDLITDNSGDNALVAGSGADTLIDNTGSDTFVVNNTGDAVTETVSGTALVQSSVNWTLGANVDDLTLTGSAGLTAKGNTDDDILSDSGGTAADTLIGNSYDGGDTFIVSNSGDAVSEAVHGGLVEASVSYTLGATVDTLMLVGSGSLTGTGNAGNDVLSDGGVAADKLIGNSSSGDDTFVVNNTGDSVTEAHGGGTALVQSSVSWTLGTNTNNLILTGSDITGSGNSAADVIFDAGGDNILASGSGADTLIDTIGGDTFVVNNTGDSVTENVGGGAALVESGVSWTLGANIDNLTLTGSSGLVGKGNTGNDILTSNTGVDTLVGNSSTGADTFVVNNTGDLITETGTGTATLVKSSVNWTLGTGFDQLILSGSGNLSGVGNTANDVLAGNTGADTLVGKSTAGADTFVVNNTGDSLTEMNSGTAALVRSSVNWTLGANLEDLTLTGTAALKGVGNTGNDILTADGSAADTLVGNSAAGADTFVVNNTADFITETNSGTAATVYSSVSYVLSAAHIESLVLTSSGIEGIGETSNNITITDDAGNNVLESAIGADTFVDNAGNDVFVVNNTGDVVTENVSGTAAEVISTVSWTLGTKVDSLSLEGISSSLTGIGNTDSDVLSDVGGPFADTLIGNSSIGGDTFVLNNTGDTITEVNSGTTAAIEASFNYTLGAGFDQLTLIGLSNLVGVGNTLNDILTSNTGADTLIGNSSSGADTFIVNNLEDSITETNTGTAVLVQSSVNWTLGTSFDQLTLIGSSNLVGVGNTGNDILISNTGMDTLVGNSSTGADTFVVNNLGDSLTEKNSGTAALVKSSVNWTLSANINNLVLTGSSNLTGAANSVADVITGNTGNDVLSDGSGTAADTLIGNSSGGDDTFVVNNIGTSLTETNSGGIATVDSSVNWTLGANINNLALIASGITGTGNSAADVISDSSGSNVLVTGSGADTLIDDTGSDTFVVNSTSDSVTENVGGGALIKSSVNWTLGTNIDQLTLLGTSALTERGNTDNDILTSNSGVDTLIGNSTAGDDTFVLNNTGDSVTETNSGTAAKAIAGFNYTLSAHLEDLVLTGSSNLVGTGNTLSDVLVSNSGVDTLIGNSTAGNDTFVLSNTGDSVTETNSGTAAKVVVGFNYTLGAHLEDLVLTGSSNLVGTGNTLADVLVSNSGVDTLIGNSAAGDDTFVLNNTADTFTETHSGTAAVIEASFNYTLGSSLTGLTLTGSNLVGTGNASNDVLSDGGIGPDTLVGNSSSGADTFVVSNASDSLTETNSGTAATVDASVDWTLGANTENLVLTATGIVGTGNSSNNLITDDAGDNALVAGAGNATLVDTVGNDAFIVNNTGDVVTEDVSGTQAVVGSSVNWTLGANVDELVLTAAGLVGKGNSDADILSDEGGAGADTLIGKSTGGADTFYLSNTADSITETTLTGNAAIDSSFSYTLGTGFDQLTLLGSGLVGTGNTSANLLSDGGYGPDTLIGNSTAGADTFILTNTADSFTETHLTGDAAIEATFNYTLGTGFDQLTLLGNSLIGTGNNNNDILSDGGIGPDTLIGNSSSGADTFVVNNTDDSITETNSGGAALVQSSVNWTLGANTNSLTLEGTAALTATGNSSADTIIGNTGNDTITANSSAITLQGGTTDVINGNSNTVTVGTVGGLTLTGSNTVAGASGATLTSNTITFDSHSLAGTFDSGMASGDLTYTLSGTTLTVSDGSDTLTDNNFTNGQFGITITSANEVTGGSGDATLSDAGAGNGNYTLIGNSTNGGDEFIVNNTGDVVTEANGGGAALVISSVNWTLGTHIDRLTLTGTANLVGTGNTDNDILTSNTGADTLVGNSSSGADTFVVNNTGDSLTETNSGTAAVVDSSVSWTLGTHFEALTLTGSSTLTGVGNSVADILTGNTGNDVLVAGSGVATMIGNSAGGADTFVVNNTGDTITEANSGIAALVESNINWTLGAHLEKLTLTGSSNLTGTGNTSANIITGNTGNDALNDGGAGGNDTLIGNSTSGSDTFIVNNTGDSITETNSGGAALVQSSVNWTLGTNINALTLEGTAALTATGNSNVDTIVGNTGNDTITANSSVIALQSGTSDVISGSSNTITVGTGGGLTLTGSNTVARASGATLTSNTITFDSHSLAGTFTSGVASGGLTYTLSAAVLTVTDGSHTLTDNNFTNSQFGITVNAANIVTGGSGNATLSDAGAGNGNYTLIGNSTSGGDEFIVNNTGDSVTESNGGSAALVVSSVNWTLGSHIDRLTLTGTANLVGTGNTDNDILTSNTGIDTLVGNSSTGADTFVVNNTGDSLTETNSGTAALVDSSVSWTLGTHLEKLTLTGSSNITGTGNSSANVVTGNTGNDVLVAGSGAATLIGNSTAGADTFVVNSTADSVTESNSGTAALVKSSISYTLGTHLENLTLTGSGNLSGAGNSVTDVITGNTGNDVLSAGTGAATLIGNSTVGADTFVVNNTTDSVTENNSGTAATVDSSVNWTLGTHLEALILTGSAALVGRGNTSTDVLTSNTGADTLVGNSSSGNDTFLVNNTADHITETNSGTAGTVESSVNWTLGTNLEELTLTGSSSLKGVGNSGIDVLSDGTGAAADTLVGESTNGSDTFLVNNTGDSITEAHYSSNEALVVSSVSFTLVSNVDDLTFTGTAAVKGIGNYATDILTSNTGADTLVGNSIIGSDTFVVNNPGDSVTENDSGYLTALVDSSVNWTLGANMDNLTFTGTSALKGVGNYSTDVMTSNTGADTLVGNSLIGSDTFIVNNASDSLTENYSGSTALVESDVSWTLGTNIEKLTLEGTSSLTATGNSASDTISGDTGNDVLIAGSGVATLVGNSTAGADTFVVNNASDSVTETNSGTVALVKSSANYTLGTHLEELILTGSSSLKGVGNSGTDTLSDGTGTAADTLVGESSNGSDTFIVNNTNDTVSEAHYSSNTALVESSVSFTLVSNVDDLTFTGTAAVKGTGNYATDILTSNTGADTLVGNSLLGTDTFVVNNASDSVTENYGGSTALVDSSVNWTLGTHLEKLTLAGSGITGTLNNSTDTITDDSASGGDTLTGGTGADDFVLASAGVYNSIDVLNNFSTSHSDKIDISTLMSAAGYHSGTSTLADFVQTVNSGSNSLLQIDTTGTGSHFQTIATITGITSINVATYVSNGNLVV
jgi:Ca2+-binding RTX toxin-like protein